MLNKKTKVLYFDLRLWCRVGAQQMFPQKAAWEKKEPYRVRLCSGCAVPRCAGLCLAVPFRAVLCHAVLCCGFLCLAVPCNVMLCHAVLCCVLLCLAVPCHAIWCRAMPCLAVPCCAVQDCGSCTRMGADGSSLSSPAPDTAVVALNLQKLEEQQVLCLMWEGTGNFPDCPLRLCHDALCSTRGYSPAGNVASPPKGRAELELLCRDHDSHPGCCRQHPSLRATGRLILRTVDSLLSKMLWLFPTN